MNPTPSTILMTTDAVGGVWTYAMELCRALPSIHFVMANMGPPPSVYQREEIAELPHVQLEESNFYLEWMDNAWADLDRAGAWLLSLEAKHRPDLIHLNGYVHGSLPWQAPVMIVGHSCVLSWWLAVKGEHAPDSWNRYADAVKEGLLSADQVVVPSRAMGNALLTHYNLPVQPLVIPNGRSDEGLASGDPKKPLILCAARLWDEAKNVACLANAARDLPWPLVLAGDPGEDETVFPNVNRVGHCDRTSMQMWFRNAGIYAHPARYEPFGLAPLEAAHAGCALVLADIPSLREIWGEAATFVRPDDSAGWQRTLSHLIQHPVSRARLSTKAVARAQRYSPQFMTKSYLTTYCDLLQLNHVPQPVFS